jgi:hypothetical protein
MPLGRLISFRPKGQRLAKSFFEFQRYVSHAFERPFNWVSLEVSCASLFSVIRIYAEFVRRFYLLLNVCSFEKNSRSKLYSNYLLRAGSAFDIFESGLRTLELFPFGPAAPSTYSSQVSGPSNYFLSGQQRLQEIRCRVSAPRIIFFRASSAFKKFDAGLRSLELALFRARSAFELFLSGPQRLRAISFGLASPSRQGFDLSSHLFRSNKTFRGFRFELRIFESVPRAINAPQSTCPNLGGK